VRAEKSGQSLHCSIASIPRRTLGSVLDTYMRLLSRDFHILFFCFSMLLLYILDQSVNALIYFYLSCLLIVYI
jgi:hypothetical protein